FFSSRRRHTRFSRDWSSDVCSSDLGSSAGRTRPRQQEDRAGAAVCRRLESDAPARLFEQRSRDREAEAAATGPGGEAGRAETERAEERRGGTECGGGGPEAPGRVAG